MSKGKSDYSGGGTSGSRCHHLSEVPETDTTAASPDDNNDGATTTQELADASRFNAPPSPVAFSRYTNGSSDDVSELSSITGTSHVPAASASAAERSAEAEARRRSFHTMPGAFHVQPLLIGVAEYEEGGENPPAEDEEETADGRSVDTSGATVLPDVGAAAVVDAQVEAVAVQVDEAVATYQAVPVVDALTTSRIPEDGEESSYQLESGNSQSQSASLDGGGGNGHMSNASGISSIIGARWDSASADATAPHHRSSHVDKQSGEEDRCMSIPRRYLTWGLGALLLVAVALGLGLGLARPQGSTADSSLTTNGEGEVQEVDTPVTADNGTGQNNNQDESSSYRLIEMEILSTTPVISVDPISSSLSLGLFLPTKTPGTMSRSLIAGWDVDDGVVKVYQSMMIKSNESVSFGPFIELTSISLSDIDGGKVNVGEQDGSGRENSGVRESNSIIVDAGVDGESFVLGYRNCVRFFTTLLHENQRAVIVEKEGFDVSIINPTTLIKTNTSDQSTEWYQRGGTLVGDDDPAIQGFGTSIGYSASGPHFFHRLVVGSDSGHVRAYRYRWSNDTGSRWQRLDGGLLDLPTNATGKAVVAMAGSGVRFAVGYPALGKVSLYKFNDKLVIDEDSSSSHIELVDEIYSESGVEGDMFGQSLSVDVYATFVIVGAKGYARAYWLRPTPSSVVGFKLISVGDAIMGDDSDGDQFGAVVASGRVPLHNGGCAACPFILDKQRIAISSPSYDNGRGRVILYQYNDDQEIWETLASPIEGKTNSDSVAQAVRLSPDMGSVAVTSAVGEARVFRLLPLQ